MTRFLFVYGTLRRAALHPMARWLACRAKYLGMASTRGALYEIDGDPILVPEARENRRVLGDLYELPESDIETILRHLDAYEACEPDRPGYCRVMLPVTDAYGRRYHAWVYIWAGSLERARLIPGGDYLHRGLHHAENGL